MNLPLTTGGAGGLGSTTARPGIYATTTIVRFSVNWDREADGEEIPQNRPLEEVAGINREAATYVLLVARGNTRAR